LQPKGCSSSNSSSRYVLIPENDAQCAVITEP
jgi:hypothetical protein